MGMEGREREGKNNMGICENKKKRERKILAAFYATCCISHLFPRTFGGTVHFTSNSIWNSMCAF